MAFEGGAAAREMDPDVGPARVGDAEALDRLCVTIRPLVIRRARRLLGRGLSRWVDPEDIAQRVLLQVPSLAGGLPEGATGNDLLARVMRSTHSRVVDSARRHRETLGESVLRQNSSPGTLGVAGRNPVSAGPVTRQDERRWIARLVEFLPSKYAGVVQLCGLEGLTFVEAGRRLGLHPDTVRKRYHRASELLRERASPRRNG